MAVNTGFTALTGTNVVARNNNLKVLEAFVDVSKLTGAALATNDHIQLFSIPLQSILENQVATNVPESLIVIAGMVEICKVDAGGGTISIGISSGGTELVTSQAVSALTAVATSGGVVVSTPNSSAASGIYLKALTDPMTTLQVRITLLCLSSLGRPLDSALAY